MNFNKKAALFSSLLLLFFCQQSFCFQNMNRIIVNNQNDFVLALEKVSPGDSIIIKNGVYVDWSVLINVSGTDKEKITIKPESPHGVVFTTSKIANSYFFRITGNNIVFQGLTFKNITFSNSILELYSTRNVRVTECQFISLSGDGRERRIFIINGNSDKNEIDNCLFDKNDQVQTLTLRVAPGEVPKNTFIHHNHFRDLNLKSGGEGSETLQIGQTGKHNTFDELILNTLVEDNLFENIRGDNETVSNKSNYNYFRRNTFINTNQFVLRGGHYCMVEENTFIASNGPAIRMYGSGHTIQNNIIKNPSGNGITMCYGLGSGIQAKTLRITTTDCVIKNNIIESAGGYGIFFGEGKGTDYSDHPKSDSWNSGLIQDIPPSGNIITHNRIFKSAQSPVGICGADQNTIVNNKYD